VVRDHRPPVQGLKHPRACCADVDYRNAAATAVDLESANCGSVRIERGRFGVGEIDRQAAFIRLERRKGRLRSLSRANARVRVRVLKGERLDLARGFLVGRGFEVDRHWLGARVREHLRDGDLGDCFCFTEYDFRHLCQLEMVQGRV
jgi:hypothetical protein